MEVAIAEKGYSNISTAQIAKKAGEAEGTIFNLLFILDFFRENSGRNCFLSHFKWR
ncbi:TetR family transcriptional regulator [Bacillus testis]|uniref:TetR family transcriptional regulator n=1 Tax=Bacillus testis TaxID=1622072 RepID=UPI0009E2FDAE